MVGGVADALGGAAVEPAPGSNVELTSQDGLDTGLVPLTIEFQRAEHIAMIGESDGRHAIRLGHRKQICDAIGTVEQGIFRMRDVSARNLRVSPWLMCAPLQMQTIMTETFLKYDQLPHCVRHVVPCNCRTRHRRAIDRRMRAEVTCDPRVAQSGSCTGDEY